MRRCLRRSFVLAVLALPAPWLAGAAGAADRALDERISIDLVDADPQDTLRNFAQLTGLRFEIPPALINPFTGTLRNVRVRTALDVLCESVGCAWSERPGKPSTVVVTLVAGVPQKTPVKSAASTALGEPISLDLQDADAGEVLRSFGALLSAKVELDPAIKGKISIRLKAVAARDALDGVCAQVACVWTYEPAEGGGMLHVRANGATG